MYEDIDYWDAVYYLSLAEVLSRSEAPADVVEAIDMIELYEACIRDLKYRDISILNKRARRIRKKIEQYFS